MVFPQGISLLTGCKQRSAIETPCGNRQRRDGGSTLSTKFTDKSL
jgi:hypothetical protein